MKFTFIGEDPFTKEKIQMEFTTSARWTETLEPFIRFLNGMGFSITNEIFKEKVKLELD